MRRGLATAALALACAAGQAGPAAPEEHRRTPDQTFLTFPEWYLVHSPAEYAAYLQVGAPPSAFPLFAHIGQFWQGYAAVNREIEKYPFNGGYHLMVMVIGTSTTVEYALKGVYEHTVGRLAEATRTGAAPVPEERFAAAYAQAYVDFIRVEPWYKFDFASQLKALWSELPLRGENLLRRWERRFALTSELLVKEGYARLIKLGTQSIYDAPKPVTAVLLSKAPQPDAAHADFAALPGDASRGVLATIPRYEGFTAYSRWLAAQGIDFREVAGNDGEIVVSLLAPLGQPLPASARRLFTQAVITQPGRERVVLAVPVAGLGALLREVDARAGVTVEHVYDF
ncbi:hypothetical protein [Caldimonas sp. KR1-144]|uniref:hypothetical protein n=1 Tax=Caldimonas sp. KR1-144 TaxID=3400911 RepID=UPI003C0FB30C